MNIRYRYIYIFIYIYIYIDVYIMTYKWIEKTDKNGIQERLQFATSGAVPASQETLQAARFWRARHENAVKDRFRTIPREGGVAGWKP